MRVSQEREAGGERSGELLFHFSRLPVKGVRDAKQEADPGVKPNGLWVSVGDEWPKWCAAEEFGMDRFDFTTHVELAESANILRLSGARALDRFTREYGRDEGGGIGYSRVGIDWRRVASEHDGIIIAPYCYARRLHADTRWYYGWDVASGCIWNASAIASIECVDTHREVLTAKRSSPLRTSRKGGRDG